MDYVEVFLKQKKRYFKNLSEVMKSCINQILIINETKYFSIHTSEIKVKKIKK